jgi:DNA phosphorothioation-dependent restriction protein DptH
MAYLDVAGSLRDIFVATFPVLGDLQSERIRRAIKDSFLEAGWGKSWWGHEGLIGASLRKILGDP